MNIVKASKQKDFVCVKLIVTVNLALPVNGAEFVSILSLELIA